MVLTVQLCLENITVSISVKSTNYAALHSVFTFLRKPNIPIAIRIGMSRSPGEIDCAS
jgi:hypothetical protein